TKANGIKLGFMSFFAKAAANALAKYPAVNASVDGEDIIYHGYADISIAVSTDRGLVTPVLRNVERTSFADVENGIDHDAKPASGTARRDVGYRRVRGENHPVGKGRARWRAEARGPAGRHLHHHQRRHLRLADVDADRQPAAVGDPRHAHHQGARHRRERPGR